VAEGTPSAPPPLPRKEFMRSSQGNSCYLLGSMWTPLSSGGQSMTKWIGPHLPVIATVVAIVTLLGSITTIVAVITIARRFTRMISDRTKPDSGATDALRELSERWCVITSHIIRTLEIVIFRSYAQTRGGGFLMVVLPKNLTPRRVCWQPPPRQMPHTRVYCLAIGPRLEVI
jgi:hypothetical protein